MHNEATEALTSQGTAITNLTTRVLRTPEDIDREISDLRELSNSASRFRKLGKFLQGEREEYSAADFVDLINRDLLLSVLSAAYEKQCQALKGEGVLMPAVEACVGEGVSVAKPGFFFLKDGSCYISASAASKVCVMSAGELTAYRGDTSGWDFEVHNSRDQECPSHSGVDVPRQHPAVERLPARGEVWEHYKGGEYTIECVAHDESDPNWLLVVYRGLDGRVWVRPLGEFIGLTEEGGIKRFRLVAEAKHHG